MVARRLPASAALREALAFAVRAHADQARKGSRLPYVTHPIRVAAVLEAAGCDEPVLVAAYLHDTVEDTAATIEEIEVAFGAEVATLVTAASEPDKTAPWELRKRHTIEALSVAPFGHLWVPLADKLDNVSSIRLDLLLTGEDVWRRFNRPRPRQEWYYRELAAAFAARAEVTDVPPAFAALVAELQTLIDAVFGPQGEQ